MISSMMGPTELPGDCWPTRSQTWLLRAALLSGEPGLQAWQVWKSRVGNLAGLDLGSQRLLPLLYGNLRAHHVSDPLLSTLKAHYRQTWYRNQALVHQAAELLPALQAAHIDTLILKGVALALLHYRDLGLRPMADLDLLVPAASAVAAFEVLRGLGCETSLPVGRAREFVGVRQSVDYCTPAGYHFDLHWYALWECAFPGADDAFWAGAVPIELNRISSRALNPTDQLLHVCVHGAGLNQVSPVRWAADAMQILRTPAGQVDWPRLLGHAERLRLSLPLHDTLYYLQTALDANIPEAVVQALAAMPVTAADREFHRLKISRRGLLGELPLMRQHYRMLCAARRQPATLAGFVQHTRLSWGLVEGRAIPPFVLAKAARRLRAVMRRPALAEPDLGRHS